MRVELVQSQKQTLSQNMIQSVEILQMSSMELADYIKEQSMENPVMDLDEHMPENKQEERLKKLEWLTGLDEQNRAYYRYDQEDEDKDNYLNNISAPNAETLKDVLMQQLLSNSYSKEYMQMLKTEPAAEVKDYLSKKIEQAEQIQKCICGHSA